MNDSEKINQIAQMLTDDPDIFNEMAVSTGAIAMPLGGNIKTIKKRKKRPKEDSDEVEGIKKYFADPITGQPKVKTKTGKSKKAGEILLAGSQD